jgi:TfoX-like protein
MVRNIGRKSKQWLASIGVHTLDDVVSLGVVETYKRVKAAYLKRYR